MKKPPQFTVLSASRQKYTVHSVWEPKGYPKGPLRGEEGTEMATTARVTKSSASCESFKDIGHQFRPGRGPFRAFQFRPSVVPLCHAHIYVGPLVFLSFSETTQFIVLFASHEKYIFIPDCLPKRIIICHPAYRLSESIV